MDNCDFLNKNVVITGGTGAIGFETCKQLLKNGVKSIAILDIKDCTDDDNGSEKLKDLYPDRIIEFIRTDVLSEQQVNDAFKWVKKSFKQIDIFIGLAGVSNEKNPENLININILGVVYTTIAAMNCMGKLNNDDGNDSNGKGGIIANISSVTGLNPLYFLPLYSASKHAILGFTTALAEAENIHRSHGIKFITICPGVTATPLLFNLKTMFSELQNDACQAIVNAYQNTTEEMGKLIVDILAKGSNGSVWIADKTISEISIVKHWP